MFVTCINKIFKSILFFRIFSGFLLISCLILSYNILHNNNNNNLFKINRENNNFSFVNPILDCEYNYTTDSSINSRHVNSFIEDIKQKYHINDISVYYRDLNNGQWIGVNEKEYFSPSSLLKTPILIALFKYSETNTDIFNKKILIKKEDFMGVSPQFTTTGDILNINTEYSIFDLAQKMIKDSDNLSARIVHENIPEIYVNEIFTKVGIPVDNSKDQVLMRVKDLAAFWRILYNASYLSKENSEKTLKILSETNFKNGIVAGVPSDIVVAHKFGERMPEGVLLEKQILEKGERQLHDCGIVYYPRSPYVMCIMTRGFNFENQTKSIAEISAFFYNQVGLQSKKDFKK